MIFFISLSRIFHRQIITAFEIIFLRLFNVIMYKVVIVFHTIYFIHITSIVSIYLCIFRHEESTHTHTFAYIHIHSVLRWHKINKFSS